MQRKRSIGALILVVLLMLGPMSLAQTVGPLVIIQDTPEAASNPPQVVTYVSVIDPSRAQSLDGLMADDFRLTQAGTEMADKTVAYEPVGLAIVVVVDRGGISAAGDRGSVTDAQQARIWDATGLVEHLVDRLDVSGAASDDVIAIVGVGKDGALEPSADFSYNPVDLNRALNTLGPMKEQSVAGGTPLYEGLDEAIRLLVHHPDSSIAELLSQRRKVVLVLSDGLDPDFSDKAREEDIIREAQAADISLYAIGIARRDGSLSAAGNLERLAHQTRGLYLLHNDDETHQQVLELFDRLMTQRQQYRVSYETRLPQGDYALQIAVDTPLGSASDEARFASVLEPLQLTLTAPSDGRSLQVPVTYDEAPCLYVSTKRENFRYQSTTVTLSARVTAVDGAPRDPVEVRYFANGVHIGTGTTPPNYDFAWDVAQVMTPTAQIQEQAFTLIARADDAYLGERVESQEATISVAWQPVEQTACVAWEMWIGSFWWVICLLGVLALGVLVLLVLLIRMRGKMGQMAQRVATRTTGVLKGITKRLGSSPPQKVLAKLVVVQGANVGKEFKLAVPVVKVGRDPQFSDLALYDDYVSNPHFSIHVEQTKFFIVDEGSTNGTRLNGVPLPPRQRMPLPPDGVIEVGNTRLQFKRIGGTTRQLGGGEPSSPPTKPPQQKPHPATPSQPGPSAQAPQSAAPVPQETSQEPESAPEVSLPPPRRRPRRGGPTVQLPEEEPAPDPRRGGETVKLAEAEEAGAETVRLPEEGPAPEPRRGGETVKLAEAEEAGAETVRLPEEGPAPEPRRGGETVKLAEAEETGAETVRLPEEGPAPEPRRGGETVKLAEAEEAGAETVRLPEEEPAPEPRRGGETVKLSEEED